MDINSAMYGGLYSRKSSLAFIYCLFTVHAYTIYECQVSLMK
jgi:hypothetical protein